MPILKIDTALKKVPVVGWLSVSSSHADFLSPTSGVCRLSWHVLSSRIVLVCLTTATSSRLVYYRVVLMMYGLFKCHISRATSRWRRRRILSRSFCDPDACAATHGDRVSTCHKKHVFRRKVMRQLPFILCLIAPRHATSRVECTYAPSSATITNLTPPSILARSIIFLLWIFNRL